MQRSKLYRLNKKRIRNWLGPDLVKLIQKIVSLILKPRLTYASKSWATEIPEDLRNGWNSESLIDTKLKNWKRVVSICESPGPLGFSYENEDLLSLKDVSFHNIHITFGYILALATRMKNKISILDWGGGMGHYYLLAKALVPDVELDYHCVEVPNMVNLVKNINKDVKWYSDKTFLHRKFDIVMVNASLQYVRDWKDFISEISSVTTEYFFLTRIPVVEQSQEFLAVQREGNVLMLHIQFNLFELIKTIESNNFQLLREFVVGDKPFIKSAPEQCELRGWLFKKINK